MQMMQDIAYMFASHTQQLMTQDLYVKTTGRWQEVLQPAFGQNMKVTPFDLLIDYDVMEKDGSVQANDSPDLWVQMFQILSQNPLIAQQFDIVKVFGHTAKMLGAKNIDDFRAASQRTIPQIVPDQKVEDQVQAGNLVPVGGPIQ